jgi:hypothetical protein
VTFPAFKAGDSTLCGPNGGFDFHTPPPHFVAVWMVYLRIVPDCTTADHWWLAISRHHEDRRSYSLSGPRKGVGGPSLGSVNCFRQHGACHRDIPFRPVRHGGPIDKGRQVVPLNLFLQRREQFRLFHCWTSDLSRDIRSRMATEAKRSFFRFGGSLDRIYNWLLGIFFALSLFVHLGPGIRDGRVPEVLGTTVGQTAAAAIMLFIVFKSLSLIRR